MRRLLKVLCLVAIVGTLGGCASTERSTIWSSGYWKRHFKKLGEELHQFRVDIDRTIFDLEDRPIEEQ